MSTQLLADELERLYAKRHDLLEDDDVMELNLQAEIGALISENVPSVLAALRAQGWISVQERLPAAEVEQILCYSKAGIQYCLTGQELHSQLHYAGDACNWTHWQPLPAPPNERAK